MERAVRIAVAGTVDARLVGDLRALPLHPDVRAFVAVDADTEAIAGYEPDVLIAGLGVEAAEEIGALRMLRRLWPHTAMVLATDVAGEIATAAAAQRIGARVLVHPNKPGHLAAVIEQALHGGDRPRPDVFLDLAHGMADEINNPLLFVSGHLQLLHSSLDPQRERDRRDQIRSALDGVQRIQATVDRLRLLSQAANGPRQRSDVDLAVLLQSAMNQRPAGEPGASATVADAGVVVRGDAEQLAPALLAVARFADALAAAGITTTLALDATGGAARLRLDLRGDGLRQWRLPHTFEPFYPTRLLRGHGHGLSLFLLQTVVLGHGGQATARRQPDGSLRLDFVLPA